MNMNMRIEQKIAYIEKCLCPILQGSLKAFLGQPDRIVYEDQLLNEIYCQINLQFNRILSETTNNEYDLKEIDTAYRELRLPDSISGHLRNQLLLYWVENKQKISSFMELVSDIYDGWEMPALVVGETENEFLIKAKKLINNHVALHTENIEKIKSLVAEKRVKSPNNNYFDTKNSMLIIDEWEIPIIPATNEFYLCKFMFEKEPRTSIEIMTVYRNVSWERQYAEKLDEREIKIAQKMIRDTALRINKKMFANFFINKPLFDCRGKTIIRNF